MVDLSLERREVANWLPTSAVTGEGLDRLTDAMIARLAPHVPHKGEGVPFLAEHVECLQQARRGIDRSSAEDAIDALQAMLTGRRAT
jgi:hypothetical protein